MAYRRLLTNLMVILTLTGTKKRLVGVEAGCLGGENELRPDVLRSHRAPVDPTLMSPVYQKIDKILQNSVPGNDLDANMKMVMRLLRVEIACKLPRTKRFCFGLGTNSLMSQDFDKNITTNALLRLNDLKKVKKSGLGCSVLNTNHLAENNAIARDPIGRRLRNEPDLLPRIDNLIFDLAEHRAEHCLPKYKELLTNIFNLDSYRVIVNYWDPIFEHRLTKANFSGHEQVDSAFRNSPEQALSFFEDMRYAIADDEMDTILKYLSAASANSSFKFPYDGTDPNIRKFEKFARIPCVKYIDTTSNLLESFTFDIKLKPNLSAGSVSPVGQDHIVHRLKAYYVMCEKLVSDKDRYVHLLNRHLINSLPYKSDAEISSNQDDMIEDDI